MQVGMRGTEVDVRVQAKGLVCMVNNARRAGAAALALLVCLTVVVGLPQAACASGAYTMSITAPDGFGTGVEYCIYKVTDASDEWTADFDGCGIDLSSTEAAVECASYVQAHDIHAFAEHTTDTTGQTAFTDLDPGVYLAVGSKAPTDAVTYAVSPALVRISTASVNVNSKGEMGTLSTGDEGSTGDDSPSGTAGGASGGTTGDGSGNANGGNNGGSSGGNGGASGNGGSGNDGSGAGAEALPQTGQLWWPVPVLVVLGTALVMVGLIRRVTPAGR